MISQSKAGKLSSKKNLNRLLQKDKIENPADACASVETHVTPLEKLSDAEVLVQVHRHPRR